MRSQDKIRECFYCGHSAGKNPLGLRPYGPNGEDVCAGCVIGHPTREAEAVECYQKMLVDACKVSDVVVMTTNGPAPYISKIQKRMRDERNRNGDVVP